MEERRIGADRRHSASLCSLKGEAVFIRELFQQADQWAGVRLQPLINDVPELILTGLCEPRPQCARCGNLPA